MGLAMSIASQAAHAFFQTGKFQEHVAGRAILELAVRWISSNRVRNLYYCTFRRHRSF